MGLGKYRKKRISVFAEKIIDIIMSEASDLLKSYALPVLPEASSSALVSWKEFEESSESSIFQYAFPKCSVLASLPIVILTPVVP